MNTIELTDEQLAEVKKRIYRENSSKGGSNGWNKLSKKEQEERIIKIQAARKLKREQLKLDKSSS